MKIAAISGSGFKNDIIFDVDHHTNRDNAFDPYIELKNHLLKIGFDLHTKDCCGDKTISLELHSNVKQVNPSIPSYVILFETTLTYPKNEDPVLLKQYRKIFTWDSRLVDGDRFIKIHYPNPFVIPAIDGFKNRRLFSCLISSNKTVSKQDMRELYSERIKTIRWFEKNAPTDFELYGIGWDKPAPQAGKKLRNSFIKRAWKFARFFNLPQPFPSYRGPVAHKYDIYKISRFCICYENARDISGYVTEKIFDCFFSGCVPVYWGANDVSGYIPSDCFIDRRNFRDTADLYHFLKEVTEDQFKAYQARIITYLKSEQAIPFTSRAFAEIISNAIAADLGVT